MGAYDDAAEVYLASGLWPIPVMGKNPPVSGATGYEGTVTFEKVNAWLHPDPNVRARAGRGARMDNVAIRHGLTLAIDVDHGYGDKDGVTQLAEFARKHGLPPLPATWSSTARGDDSPSRQHLYAIPEDARLKTKPCKAVELCNWHHRFTVAAPSIHPNTGNAYAWYLPGAPGVPPAWGARTDRYPTRAEFAPLPGAWFEVFRGAVIDTDKAAVVVELPALLASFAPGEPDGLVNHLIEKWSDETNHLGHDETKDALIHAFMLGREGHPGVGELVGVLLERFADYLAVARPAEAEREARSLVEACATIAQQKRLRPVVVGRMPTPAEFMAGAVVVGMQAPQVEQATNEDIDAFLATFTTYRTPRRLANRKTWMQADPAGQLPRHAFHLVCEAIAGHYPAAEAVRALLDGYRHHGVADASLPKSDLRLALGAILNAKAVA